MVEMAGGSSTTRARASRAPLGMTDGEWRMPIKKNQKNHTNHSSDNVRRARFAAPQGCVFSFHAAKIMLKRCSENSRKFEKISFFARFAHAFFAG
jgi:hypothetical protein